MEKQLGKTSTIKQELSHWETGTKLNWKNEDKELAERGKVNYDTKNNNKTMRY